MTLIMTASHHKHRLRHETKHVNSKFIPKTLKEINKLILQVVFPVQSKSTLSRNQI